eukprot:jgi/Chlat1/4120/Chrsp269S03950
MASMPVISAAPAAASSKQQSTLGPNVWIDFLVSPAKLDEHIAALKAAGSSSNAIAGELLSTLLEQSLVQRAAQPTPTAAATNAPAVAVKPAELQQASKPPAQLSDALQAAAGKPDAAAPAASRRAKLLQGFAAKIASELDLSLETVETILPPRLQRMLLELLVTQAPHDRARRMCDLHRWQLRAALRVAASAKKDEECAAVVEAHEGVAKALQRPHLPLREEESAAVSFLKQAALDGCVQSLAQIGASQTNGAPGPSPQITLPTLTEENFYTSAADQQLLEAIPAAAARSADNLQAAAALALKLAAHFNESAPPTVEMLQPEYVSLIHLDLGEYLFHRHQFAAALEQLRSASPINHATSAQQKAQGMVEACAAALSKDLQFDASNTDQLLLWRIEKARHCCDGEVVLSTLLEDNQKHELTSVYRQALEINDRLVAVRMQIAALNAVCCVIKSVEATGLQSRALPWMADKVTVEWLFKAVYAALHRSTVWPAAVSAPEPPCSTTASFACGAETANKLLTYVRGVCAAHCQMWCWQMARAYGLVSEADLQLGLQLAADFKGVASQPVTQRNLLPKDIETSLVARKMAVVRASSPGRLRQAASQAEVEERGVIAARVVARGLLDEKLGLQDSTRLFATVATMDPSNADSQLSQLRQSKVPPGNVQDLIGELIVEATSAHVLQTVCWLIDCEAWPVLAKACSDISDHPDYNDTGHPCQEELLLAQLLAELLKVSFDYDATVQLTTQQRQDKHHIRQHASQLLNKVLMMTCAKKTSSAQSAMTDRSDKVPLMCGMSSPKARHALIALVAGWLNNSHLAGHSGYAIAVDRYGSLAALIAGNEAEPSELSPSSVRNLFGLLLRHSVVTEGVVQDYRWLQGLADLAFEDDHHLEALQMYLRAGAAALGNYSGRSTAALASATDIFTPWVVRRMVHACSVIGAVLPAACLCQFLNPPGYSLAYPLIQEEVFGLDARYFPYVWEMPLLELLVHLHSQAKHESRVQQLIQLLQHPAINQHNPSSVRSAYIATLKLRFLRQLSADVIPMTG